MSEDSIISVVIPVWNEEGSLPRLVDRLKELIPGVEIRFEFVLVNDGSTDGTQEQLLKLLPALHRWKLIKLSRNFGQQAAYRAGLEHASGAAIVFLDADLQDPPELIPALIAAWQKGSKVVVGRRRSRAEKGLKGFLLRRFHGLFHTMTGGVMPKDSGTFGLMDKKVADTVRQMPELNLFLPALRSWAGYSQSTIWYDRAAREGEAKQTLSKLFNYAWDGIVSFSELPLKIISWMGVLVSLIGFSYAIILTVIKLLQLFGFFTAWIVPGFTTLAVAVLCVGGMQLISLGIVGQYIARIYREVKGRPIFVTEEIITSQPEDGT